MMSSDALNKSALGFAFSQVLPFRGVVFCCHPVRRLLALTSWSKSKIILAALLGIVLSGEMTAQTDSLIFKTIQSELEGCWHTKYYRFKYNSERNLGIYHSSANHTSGPIFKLIIREDGVYIKWMQLLGGEHDQKVLWIKKKRLRLENSDGSKTMYRRNRGCSL